MTFELFEKGHHLIGNIPDDEISVRKTWITFGKNAREFLTQDFIEVYLDREQNRVGLKPSNDPVKGFKAIRKGDKGVPALVGSFVKLLPPSKYKVSIEEGLLVFNVPEMARKNGDLETLK